ncbi:hypothetical protein [Lactiplantibacillus daowaiensis]|uniref:Uncharacterized protein n=1 Tax=Lactiplantibacillus daowaiensis TaxID=2559918 RepID=A0ABW1RXS4_9LACO|nr:hypothetical protein [Lactiplantibacillus daowaiensis]
MKEPDLKDVLGQIFDETFGEGAKELSGTDLAAKAFYSAKGKQQLVITLDENGFTVKDPEYKEILPLMLDKFISTYIKGNMINEERVATMIGMMSDVVNGYVEMVVHNTMVDAEQKRRGE